MAIQPPQRFELDDLAHVEREARTIYAPGATPGDVLVVQSDHSLVAAPGGGSMPGNLYADCMSVDDNIDVQTGGLDPLSNGGTVDGFTLIDGSRVALGSQTDSTENGVWVASAGAWTRPDDFANGATFQASTLIYVGFGTENVGWWRCCNGDTGTEFTVGTDTIGVLGIWQVYSVTGASVFLTEYMAAPYYILGNSGHGVPDVSPQVMAGTADPSGGAGISAGMGSIYGRQNGSAGELWLKTGAADTAWTQIAAP